MQHLYMYYKHEEAEAPDYQIFFSHLISIFIDFLFVALPPPSTFCFKISALEQQQRPAGR